MPPLVSLGFPHEVGETRLGGVRRPYEENGRQNRKHLRTATFTGVSHALAGKEGVATCTAPLPPIDFLGDLQIRCLQARQSSVFGPRVFRTWGDVWLWPRLTIPAPHAEIPTKQGVAQ
jgi:hypothetical protein